MRTQDDKDFLIGFGERIGHPNLRENDKRAVDGSPKPRDMSVPKKGAFLPYNGEVVHVALPGLDRALSHIGRSIGPPAPQLSNTVPKTDQQICESTNSLSQEQLVILYQ